MKTVSMWSYESGAREINIHDVEPEVFDKLLPVLDVEEAWGDRVGRINIDKNTAIYFYKKQDDEKEASNEVPVENAEAE